MNQIFLHILPIILGFLLDLLLGDPSNWPHPVRVIGNAIASGEKKLRPLAMGSSKKLFLAGAMLSIVVSIGAFLIPFLLLYFCDLINSWLKTALATLFCYQILATKCLRDESMKVYKILQTNNISSARQALSRIVGRDTKNLNHQEITKATVETISENCSDGVIAPLFYLFIGGAPLGMMYKAINTLDSMIAYKNEKYLYFGKFAARLDDIANFIPSRLCALLMLFSGAFNGYNFTNGLKIWIRDRYNHSSPNSAQTESVCAGLFGIQLAGDAYYGGNLVKKPTIGDDIRPVLADDILKTNKLMYITAFLGIILFSLVIILIRGVV